MEGLKLEPAVSSGFPSALWPLLPYQGQGQIPSCCSRSPEGWLQAGSVPFVCALPQTGEQCWSERGLCGLSARDGARAVTTQAQTEVRAASLSRLCKRRSGCSHLAQAQPRGHVFFVPHSQACLQPLPPPPCCGAMPQGRWGPCGLWSLSGWGLWSPGAVREQGCF